MNKQTKNKIIYGVIIFIALLGGIIAFIIINPANNQRITDTKNKFLPFGNTPDIENGSFDTITISDNVAPSDNQPLFAQKMKRLVDAPVAGATFFTNSVGQINIRYAEQKTGDIYDYSLDTGISKLILRQNLPGVHNVLWGSNGQNAVFRFLKTVVNQDTIKTYILSFEEPGLEEKTIFSGKFLPDNIQEVIVSPSGKKVAYIQKNEQGDSFVMLEEIKEGQNREQIFASPFSEWLLEQPTENLLTLTTKPSYDIDGYLYFTDIASGVTTKILGNKKGLTALTSPDATKILYAKNEEQSYKLILYNVDTKEEINPNINSFPEKCVWGAGDGNLLYCAVPNLIGARNIPDKWYQGEVSYSDDIWLINTETKKAGLIAKTNDFNQNGIDVIKPFLSLDNRQLLFTNKIDNSLWLLELEK